MDYHRMNKATGYNSSAGGSHPHIPSSFVDTTKAPPPPPPNPAYAKAGPAAPQKPLSQLAVGTLTHLSAAAQYILRNAFSTGAEVFDGNVLSLQRALIDSAKKRMDINKLLTTFAECLPLESLDRVLDPPTKEKLQILVNETASSSRSSAHTTAQSGGNNDANYGYNTTDNTAEYIKACWIPASDTGYEHSSSQEYQPQRHANNASEGAAENYSSYNDADNNYNNYTDNQYNADYNASYAGGNTGDNYGSYEAGQVDTGQPPPGWNQHADNDQSGFGLEAPPPPPPYPPPCPPPPPPPGFSGSYNMEMYGQGEPNTDQYGYQGSFSQQQSNPTTDNKGPVPAGGNQWSCSRAPYGGGEQASSTKKMGGNTIPPGNQHYSTAPSYSANYNAPSGMAKSQNYLSTLSTNMGLGAGRGMSPHGASGGHRTKLSIPQHIGAKAKGASLRPGLGANSKIIQNTAVAKELMSTVKPKQETAKPKSSAKPHNYLALSTSEASQEKEWSLSNTSAVQNKPTLTTTISSTTPKPTTATAISSVESKPGVSVKTEENMEDFGYGEDEDDDDDTWSTYEIKPVTDHGKNTRSIVGGGDQRNLAANYAAVHRDSNPSCPPGWPDWWPHNRSHLFDPCTVASKLPNSYWEILAKTHDKGIVTSRDAVTLREGMFDIGGKPVTNPYPIMALVAWYINPECMRKVTNSSLRGVLKEVQKRRGIRMNEYNAVMTGGLCPMTKPAAIRLRLAQARVSYLKSAIKLRVDQFKGPAAMPQPTQDEIDAKGDPMYCELTDIPGYEPRKPGEQYPPLNKRVKKWMPAVLYVMIKQGRDIEIFLERMHKFFGDEQMNRILSTQRLKSTIANARKNTEFENKLNAAPEFSIDPATLFSDHESDGEAAVEGEEQISVRDEVSKHLDLGKVTLEDIPGAVSMAGHMPVVTFNRKVRCWVCNCLFILIRSGADIAPAVKNLKSLFGADKIDTLLSEKRLVKAVNAAVNAIQEDAEIDIEENLDQRYTAAVAELKACETEVMQEIQTQQVYPRNPSAPKPLFEIGKPLEKPPSSQATTAIDDSSGISGAPPLQIVRMPPKYDGGMDGVMVNGILFQDSGETEVARVPHPLRRGQWSGDGLKGLGAVAGSGHAAILIPPKPPPPPPKTSLRAKLSVLGVTNVPGLTPTSSAAAADSTAGSSSAFDFLKSAGDNVAINDLQTAALAAASMPMLPSSHTEPYSIGNPAGAKRFGADGMMKSFSGDISGRAMHNANARLGQMDLQSALSTRDTEQERLRVRQVLELEMEEKIIEREHRKLTNKKLKIMAKKRELHLKEILPNMPIEVTAKNLLPEDVVDPTPPQSRIPILAPPLINSYPAAPVSSTGTTVHQYPSGGPVYGRDGKPQSLFGGGLLRPPIYVPAPVPVPVSTAGAPINQGGQGVPEGDDEEWTGDNPEDWEGDYGDDVPAPVPVVSGGNKNAYGTPLRNDSTGQKPGLLPPGPVLRGKVGPKGSLLGPPPLRGQTSSSGPMGRGFKQTGQMRQMSVQSNRRPGMPPALLDLPVEEPPPPEPKPKVPKLGAGFMGAAEAAPSRTTPRLSVERPTANSNQVALIALGEEHGARGTKDDAPSASNKVAPRLDQYGRPVGPHRRVVRVIKRRRSPHFDDDDDRLRRHRGGRKVRDKWETREERLGERPRGQRRGRSRDNDDGELNDDRRAPRSSLTTSRHRHASGERPRRRSRERRDSRGKDGATSDGGGEVSDNKRPRAHSSSTDAKPDTAASKSETVSTDGSKTCDSKINQQQKSAVLQNQKDSSEGGPRSMGELIKKSENAPRMCDVLKEQPSIFVDKTATKADDAVESKNPDTRGDEEEPDQTNATKTASDETSVTELQSDQTRAEKIDTSKTTTTVGNRTTMDKEVSNPTGYTDSAPNDKSANSEPPAATVVKKRPSESSASGKGSTVSDSKKPAITIKDRDHGKRGIARRAVKKAVAPAKTTLSIKVDARRGKTALVTTALNPSKRLVKKATVGNKRQVLVGKVGKVATRIATMKKDQSPPPPLDDGEAKFEPVSDDSLDEDEYYEEYEYDELDDEDRGDDDGRYDFISEEISRSMDPQPSSPQQKKRNSSFATSSKELPAPRTQQQSAKTNSSESLPAPRPPRVNRAPLLSEDDPLELEDPIPAVRSGFQSQKYGDAPVSQRSMLPCQSRTAPGTTASSGPNLNQALVQALQMVAAGTKVLAARSSAMASSSYSTGPPPPMGLSRTLRPPAPGIGLHMPPPVGGHGGFMQPPPGMLPGFPSMPPGMMPPPGHQIPGMPGFPPRPMGRPPMIPPRGPPNYFSRPRGPPW